MRTRILFLALSLFSLASKGQSHSFSGTVAGNFSVSTILSVSISQNTGTATFPNCNALQNGVTTNNFCSISVKSNILWLASVKAQDNKFTPMTQGAASNMPLSVMGIRLNGLSTFTAISATDFTLKTGSRGNNLAPGNTFGIDMNFNPGFTYPGGVYSLGLLYTLTNQ